MDHLRAKDINWTTVVDCPMAVRCAGSEEARLPFNPANFPSFLLYREAEVNGRSSIS